MDSIQEFAQLMADTYGVSVGLVHPRKLVSKRSVNYRKSNSASKRCGTCTMYHASRCDLVEGYIDPTSVCDRWEAKPDSIELVLPPSSSFDSISLTPITVSLPVKDVTPEVVPIYSAEYSGIQEMEVVELQRHVRTERGVAFFHEPIGTPITEEEYQSLLAQRRAAKEQFEPGHPERISAERAVRQARTQRRSSTSPSSGQDAVADELERLHTESDKLLSGLKTEASVIGKSGVSRPSVDTGKSNFVTRDTDKRLSQGQPESNFAHHTTGASMSKSEIGDTYEELFRMRGAHLLEESFGGDYEMISHAGGGSRTTPLDFRLDHLFGGELKTLSSDARNQKTAIKKEQLERKYRAVAEQKLKPLLVVQVVNQATGNVDVYAHPEFASKKVSTMRKLGSYSYTHDHFREANQRAGYSHRTDEMRAPVVANENSSGKAKLEGDALWKSNAGKVDISPSEAKSISRVWYANSVYRDTSTALRSGKPLSSDAQLLDNKIRSVPPLEQPIKIQRGVEHASPIFGKLGSSVGKSYTDPGFVSGSVNPDVVSNFLRETEAPYRSFAPDATTVSIIVPAGEHILRADSPSLWKNGEEDSELWREFTLPTKTEFRIVSDKLVDGRRETELVVVPGSTHPSKTPLDAMAARLTGDAHYQQLLDQRREARERYPAGHPRRLDAERAVRQARRQIHSGGTPTTPARRETPSESSRPTSVSPRAAIPTANSPTANNLPTNVSYQFVWSARSAVNYAFAAQAKGAIDRQLTHQSGKLPYRIVADAVDVIVTQNPGELSDSNTLLGSYRGSYARGSLKLHPRIFPHTVVTPDGTTHKASFYDRNSQPHNVLKVGIASKWWVPVDAKWQLSDHVIAHEVGHGVNVSLFSRTGNDSGIPNRSEFWTGFAQALGLRAPRIGSSERNAYTYDSIRSWMEANRATLVYAVSEYGASKPREMFAELWAEYTLSRNPRAAAKYYGEYVTRVLRKRAGV